jgi:hypothetical protein
MSQPIEAFAAERAYQTYAYKQAKRGITHPRWSALTPEERADWEATIQAGHAAIMNNRPAEADTLITRDGQTGTPRGLRMRRFG